jgi:putative glutathione S-transferase
MSRSRPPDGGYPELRPLYQASSHQHPGPAVAPVLSDAWTATIVSTHAPDILRDLARRLGGGGPDLFPRGAEEAVEAIARLCEQDITASAQRAGEPDVDPAARDAALASLLHALDTLERRLASQEYVLGGEPTLADVELWVTLVQLDTVHRHHLDATAVHHITGHPHLWAYAKRLAAHPDFGTHLDLDGIARRHHAHCRGMEAAGAAVQIVDWAAYAGG